jgi:hypothetical protein
LTSVEEVDALTTHLRFDLNLLANRFIDATNWIIDYNNKNKAGVYTTISEQIQTENKDKKLLHSNTKGN